MQFSIPAIPKATGKFGLSSNERQASSLARCAFIWTRRTAYAGRAMEAKLAIRHPFYLVKAVPQVMFAGSVPEKFTDHWE
jgi:hypothetical protein